MLVARLGLIWVKNARIRTWLDCLPIGSLDTLTEHCSVYGSGREGDNHILFLLIVYLKNKFKGKTGRIPCLYFRMWFWINASFAIGLKSLDFVQTLRVSSH